MPKRVLIAEDNKFVRRAICALLTKWPEVEICAETDDGRKILDTALTLVSNRRGYPRRANHTRLMLLIT